MARGESGRIVLEIDPSQKDNLYTALTKDGMTLKDWFLRQASQYLSDRAQMSLFDTRAIAEDPPSSHMVTQVKVESSPYKKPNRKKQRPK
jgi:hypothetical protein